MASKKKKTSVDSGRSEEEEHELAMIASSTDPHVLEIQRRVTSVFEMFDQSNKRMVDVREIGSIVRAMDLYPTEAEVDEIIQNTEESSAKGIVKLERFMPYMTKVIMEGTQYKPIPCERLKKAFRLLDKDKKGLLDPAKLKDIFMREGEPFAPEEIDEMLNFAVNKDTGKIHWQEYLTHLCRPDEAKEPKL